MTLQQKFNEYIASGDITISDEQRDWILPFIERCVGEERELLKGKLARQLDINQMSEGWERWWVRLDGDYFVERCLECENTEKILNVLTQEDKIK